MLDISKSLAWACMAIILIWLVTADERDLGAFGARVYQGFIAELEK